VSNDYDNPRDPLYYAEVEHQYWDVAYSLWGASALLAQSLKYVMRAGKKSSSSMLRDVRCAQNYLKHLEEKLVAEEAKKPNGASER
jgi:hypothetical protein